MTSKYTATRIFSWVLQNSIFLALGVLAFQYQLGWAQSLFHFIFWLQFVASMLLVFNEEMRLKFQVRGRSVPEPLSQLVDWTIILGLSALGHWGMGIAWMFQAAAEAHAYDPQYNKKPPTSATP